LIVFWNLIDRFESDRGWKCFRLKMQRQTIKIRKIQQATVVSKVPVSRSEAFVIRCLGNFIAIMLDHSHPAGWPEMCWKPLNLTASKLICHNQSTSLSDVFTALWYFLHRFGFGQPIIHVLSHLSGNSISIVTHRPSANRSWQRLMTFLFGVEFKIG
jgi:hypothetical protein